MLYIWILGNKLDSKQTIRVLHTMLSVAMLSVAMLSVAIVCVIVLSVTMPRVFMLNAKIPNNKVLSAVMLCLNSIHLADCQNAEYHYIKCRFTECRSATTFCDVMPLYPFGNDVVGITPLLCLCHTTFFYKRKKLENRSVKSERYIIMPRPMNSLNLIQTLMSLAFLITNNFVPVLVCFNNFDARKFVCINYKYICK